MMCWQSCGFCIFFFFFGKSEKWCFKMVTGSPQDFIISRNSFYYHRNLWKESHFGFIVGGSFLS